MSANRTPNGPRRAQSARVLARSTRNDSPKPMQPLPADASVRSAKCAFDDPSPTLRLAHRRSSLARGGGIAAGLGSGSHSYHFYLRTYHWTGRDGAASSRPARPRENANTTLFAVDIRFVLGLCKSLLFVRSARGSAGRSEVNTPYGNLTNANAVTLEAALSVPARSDCECGAREASDPRLERETSSDPYAR
jgi:hypothetical protein